MSFEHKQTQSNSLEHYYAVIMAGGGGTRLWPLSRSHYPKQMLQLFEGKSLFQLAVARLIESSADFSPSHIYVVTVAEQAPILQKQCPQIPPENYLLEPQPRGTASVIGLAAVALQHRDSKSVMAVLTADHIIRNVDLFHQLLYEAYLAALKDYLVTIGIKPTYPASGYGYIQVGNTINTKTALPIHQVIKFKEKPTVEIAKAFLESRDHLWNSGMFIWKSERILQEFASKMPELHHALMRLDEVYGTPIFNSIVTEVWQHLTTQTIDYGIMEKAKNVVVIPAEGLEWFDVGSWESLFDVFPTDTNGNILQAPLHQTIDTHHTLVFSTQDNRLIATLGINNLIIVDTADALFICPKDQAQQVRQIVEKIKNTPFE